MDKKIFDQMEGFFAYDTGCTDSGLHDELAKAKLFEHFREEAESRIVPTQILSYVTYLISEEGRDSGYTMEDVFAFFEWLSENWDYGEVI